MELIIENLTEQGFKKVVEALEPLIAGVYVNRETDTITCSLEDDAEYMIYTTSEGITIRKAEYSKGTTIRKAEYSKVEIAITAYKQQLVLKSNEYTRVIIQ